MTFGRHDAATWLAWGLVAACAILVAPLLPAVVAALWLSAAARTVHRPLTRALGGRVRIAAAITVVALTAVLVPFGLVVVSLAVDAYDYVLQLLRSPRGKAVLEQLVAKGHPEGESSNLWDVILSHQERTWTIVQQIAGTATRLVIDLFIILAGTYAVLVDGDRWYRWVERHAPIAPRLLRRLRDAFLETGHGLFVGVGGAGLLQAIVATLAYLVLDVPHAIELGVITFCFSLLPAIGTALVWVPVAAGLAMTGRAGAAIALLVIGLSVIGTVDNLIRPLLARRGHLQLPTYVVLVSMLAGVEVIGPWGLLMAPLAVRLAKAAIEDHRQHHHRSPEAHHEDPARP
jgi:predicted PurR-regulated permease PerM